MLKQSGLWDGWIRSATIKGLGRPSRTQSAAERLYVDTDIPALHIIVLKSF